MALEIIPKLGEGSPFGQNLAFQGVAADTPVVTADISGLSANVPTPTVAPTGPTLG